MAVAPDGTLTDTIRANVDDIVYLQLNGQPANEYWWGAVRIEVDPNLAEFTSVEEDYDQWYDGMESWWTTATTDPARDGGGNLYFYDHIHDPDNSNYASIGGVNAATWKYAFRDMPPNSAGPVGSLDPAGVIRFYYSGYLGDNGPIHIGLKLKQAVSSLPIKVYNHTKFAFDWNINQMEWLDEITLNVVERGNFQTVHQDGENIWVEMSGPITASSARQSRLMPMWNYWLTQTCTVTQSR